MDQQGQPHRTGERRLAHAGDPEVLLVLREIHQRHRVQDERHDVILR
jgi:hypothetical protein